jgi:hypothetical protein
MHLLNVRDAQTEKILENTFCDRLPDLSAQKDRQQQRKILDDKNKEPLKEALSFLTGQGQWFTCSTQPA